MLKSILKLYFAVPIADFKIWQNLEKIAILAWTTMILSQNIRILAKFGKNFEKIAILNVKSNSKNLLCSKVFHFRP